MSNIVAVRSDSLAYDIPVSFDGSVLTVGPSTISYRSKEYSLTQHEESLRDGDYVIHLSFPENGQCVAVLSSGSGPSVAMAMIAVVKVRQAQGEVVQRVCVGRVPDVEIDIPQEVVPFRRPVQEDKPIGLTDEVRDDLLIQIADRLGLAIPTEGSK